MSSRWTSYFRSGKTRGATWARFTVIKSTPNRKLCSTTDTTNADGPLSFCGGFENSEIGWEDRMAGVDSSLLTLLWWHFTGGRPMPASRTPERLK